MITSEQIISARKRLGENQTRFAKRFGVDQATVSRWEREGVSERITTQIALEKLLKEIAKAPSTVPRQAAARWKEHVAR